MSRKCPKNVQKCPKTFPFCVPSLPESRSQKLTSLEIEGLFPLMFLTKTIDLCHCTGVAMESWMDK